jgi:hypothetical protein
MQPLIEKIKETTREHMFQLVSKIYTSIESSQASNFFGMPEPQVLQGLENVTLIHTWSILRPLLL